MRPYLASKRAKLIVIEVLRNHFRSKTIRILDDKHLAIGGPMRDKKGHVLVMVGKSRVGHGLKYVKVSGSELAHDRSRYMNSQYLHNKEVAGTITLIL